MTARQELLARNEVRPALGEAGLVAEATASARRGCASMKAAPVGPSASSRGMRSRLSPEIGAPRGPQGPPASCRAGSTRGGEG